MSRPGNHAGDLLDVNRDLGNGSVPGKEGSVPPASRSMARHRLQGSGQVRRTVWRGIFEDGYRLNCERLTTSREGGIEVSNL
jgi:hypothetical protein